MNWHEKRYPDVLQALESDEKNGLGSSEASGRLLLHGKNKLAEKKRAGILLRFLAQLNDFMIIVLLAAAGISFAVTILEGKPDFTDPVLILLIVSLNAILGLVQENKAEKALEALKKMSAPTAKVIRGGRLLKLETETLVPGDVVMLEAGDFVPADARLISSVNLSAEESALTGESNSVEKDADIVYSADERLSVGDKRNMVFSGTSISRGRGFAVVTETGMDTEMGKIAAMLLTEESPETPLQKRLAHTGKLLGIGALLICGLIFAIGVLRRIPPFDMFMTSVSLAVAAIPEGLPAIVTITLAIGVQRMAKKHAVIRKLPAVETLGSADIICSDKTGTLTQNRMKVVEVSDGFNVLPKKHPVRIDILKIGSLCNDTVLEYDGPEPKITGDPTEAALVKIAVSEGLDKNTLERETPRIAEIPFDSKRKLMTTIHKNGSLGYLVAVKGAPDILLDKCEYYYDNSTRIPLDSEKRRQIKNTNSRMAEKALRVIGFAYGAIPALPSDYAAKPEMLEKGLTFIGLAGMIDPPREEAAAAVAVCKEASVKPVMVTGDHALTALAIAKRLGIADSSSRALTGEELNRLTQDELEANIHKYSVFARVSPEHKVRIVKAYQANGKTVAMTGDGVNDAPALKAADIGCAMGITGTDVAKGAADMVLSDDNFRTIVDAVKEGRGIYENIKKTAHFLLSSNIGEILTIFVSIVLGWDSPLLAIHLLWVNLVTDSLPAIALGMDKADEDVMHQKPYDNHKSLFSDGLWQRIIAEGFMIGFLALLAYLFGTVLYDKGDSTIIGTTMCFATLSISQLVHAFNMRSENSLFKIDILSNVYLIGAFIIGIILQVSVIMLPTLSGIFKVTPLSPQCWLIVAFLCLLPIFIVELEKKLRR